jgi:hypothetical protein
MRDERNIGNDIPLLADAGREPAVNCPDEAVLAAYADAALDAVEREALEDHLADCSYCLGQVGFLVRETDGELPAVPTDLLDAAHGRRRRRRFGWPTARAWSTLAAAAVLVIAVTAALRLDLVPGLRAPGDAATDVPSPEISTPAPDRAVRNGGIPQALEVIEPREGAEVRGAGVEVRWKPSPHALRYRVVLVSLAGDHLWEGEATDTRLTIPKTALGTGERYFVWIEARLADGGTLESAAVGFHTPPL